MAYTESEAVGGLERGLIRKKIDFCDRPLTAGHLASSSCIIPTEGWGLLASLPRTSLLAQIEAWKTDDGDLTV